MQIKISGFCLFLCGFIPFLQANAQNIAVHGRVLDETGKKPLSFVNIIEIGTTNGIASDIDGKFSIQSQNDVMRLKFSYLGFETQRIDFDKSKNDVIVYLKKSSNQLAVVTVKAKKNPADELIEKVSANRKNIDPRKAESYSFKSYNRLVATGVRDTAAENSSVRRALAGEKVDSSAIKVQEFLEKQHLFLIETVTENKFKKPERLQETVIASRTSGVKDPTISMFITQLQSFSFFEEYFSLLGINYLNPLSSGSTSKYFFEITDTNYSGTDTIFSVFYRPRKGTSFDGMTGVLNINKNKLALETAIASPAKNENGGGIFIKQNYKSTEGFWFPMQAYSEIKLGNVQFGSMAGAFIGSNYLTDIQVNLPLKNREFAGADVEIDPLAVEKADVILKQYRPDSTTAKDLKTYQVIDSIGKEMKFDRMLTGLETLLSGKLRLKYVQLDLGRIINFNNFEGVRLGLGLQTSERLFRWAQVGGYFGYGFKDKLFKYGGDAEVFFNKRRTYSLKFEYYSDLLESGMYPVEFKKSFLGRSGNRNLVVSRFDRVENTGLKLNLRPHPTLRMALGFDVQNIDAQLGYQWQPNQLSAEQSRFRFTEITFAASYSHKEKFIDNGRLYVSLGTKYPVATVFFTQGLKGVLNGQFAYTKAVASLSYNFFIKRVGRTSLNISGGYMVGDVPYVKMFNMRGNHTRGLQIVSENAFETMRMNEFVGNAFGAFFLRHNFGNIIMNNKWSKPELTISHAMGISWLQNTISRHINLNVVPMNKGYYESGFILDNILKSGQVGIGVGVFYRYGPYTLPKTIENFSFKLSAKIGL
jgi:hypothetical protein